MLTLWIVTFDNGTKIKIALLAVLLLGAPVATQAQFTYTTNADNTLTVTAYSGSGDVTIPGVACGLTVTGIGTNAFADTELTSVAMPASIVNIEDTAFSSCGSLSNVVFSPNITNIGNAAFGQCVSLTNLSIPASVSNIGSFAFIYCSSLDNLVIPPSVATVGQAAFQDCDSLTNVVIANGLSSIGNLAFLGCAKLTVITIPGSVTNIGQGAFEDCAGLTNAILSNGVASIGVGMCESCQLLRNVGIPIGVTNIGAYAFAGTALTGVSIPGTVTSIGNGAFSETPLQNVVISSNVVSIGQNAFTICSNLTNITVSASNKSYSSVNGVLFDYSRGTLIEFPAGLAVSGGYVVPATVNQIADGAFAGCGLARVTMPAGLTELGSEVFFDCPNLNVVFFEGNAPVADPSAFESDVNVAAYYLAGATGWSSPFAGIPALLWNPAMQTGDGSFGVQNNQFGFNITGTSNIMFVLEACTNLANPAWSPLRAVTLTHGAYYFSEAMQTNGSGRFYRIRSP